MANPDSSPNSEEAYADYRRTRESRKRAKAWDERVAKAWDERICDWTTEPEELMAICEHFTTHDPDLQMYDQLVFDADKIKAEDMATILNWWHTDMEKRELLNVMLHCGEDGPAAYMYNCWSKLNGDQRKVIRTLGRLTASEAWQYIHQKGGDRFEVPSWECLKKHWLAHEEAMSTLADQGVL
jgi:hypothetical protein